jgi:hypothetical protein
MLKPDKKLTLMRLIAFICLCPNLINLACNKEKNNIKEFFFNLNDTIIIGYAETKYNYEYQISITMDSVLNDSRCPVDAECIWQGNAAVRFIFSENSNKKQFVLNTFNRDRFFNGDTLAYGFRIRLLNLMPSPYSNKKIIQKDYKSKIEMSIE